MGLGVPEVRSCGFSIPGVLGILCTFKGAVGQGCNTLGKSEYAKAGYAKAVIVESEYAKVKAVITKSKYTKVKAVISRIGL